MKNIVIEKLADGFGIDRFKVGNVQIRLYKGERRNITSLDIIRDACAVIAVATSEINAEVQERKRRRLSSFFSIPMSTSQPQKKLTSRIIDGVNDVDDCDIDMENNICMSNDTTHNSTERGTKRKSYSMVISSDNNISSTNSSSSSSSGTSNNSSSSSGSSNDTIEQLNRNILCITTLLSTVHGLNVKSVKTNIKNYFDQRDLELEDCGFEYTSYVDPTDERQIWSMQKELNRRAKAERTIGTSTNIQWSQHGHKNEQRMNKAIDQLMISKYSKKTEKLITTERI